MLFGSLMIVVLVAGYARGARSVPEVREVVVQAPPVAPQSASGSATATPTPTWYDPLTTADDALLNTIDYQWPGIVPISDYAVRLVDYRTALQWLGQAEDRDRSGDEPVWIVGLLSLETMTVDEVMFPGGTVTSPSPSLPWPIRGAYYIWDANVGRVIINGPLFDSVTPQEAQPRFDDLQALENQLIPIVTPSPPATYGPEPNHTPHT